MPTNAIEALLTPEYVADLRRAAAPGESYQMKANMVMGSAADCPAMTLCHSAFANAANQVAGALSCWFVASGDGQRICGELILRPYEGAPLIVWDLAAPSKPTVQFKGSTLISFPSHIDLAEAVIRPEVAFHLIDTDQADTMIEALGSLGYRITWTPTDALHQHVEKFELQAA